jgi:hypothetical protein
MGFKIIFLCQVRRPPLLRWWSQFKVWPGSGSVWIHIGVLKFFFYVRSVVPLYRGGEAYSKFDQDQDPHGSALGFSYSLSMSGPSSPFIEVVKPIPGGLNISWRTDDNSKQEKYVVIYTRNDTDRSVPIFLIWFDGSFKPTKTLSYPARSVPVPVYICTNLKRQKKRKQYQMFFVVVNFGSDPLHEQVRNTFSSVADLQLRFRNPDLYHFFRMLCSYVYLKIMVLALVCTFRECI